MDAILSREFYNRNPLVVGREIIGKRLVRRLSDNTELTGIIVEAEAYGGSGDPASHAFRGMTKRNEVMFGEPGRAYVYFTYGVHYCLNFVTSSITGEKASAILIRAVEPLSGMDIMAKNRKTDVMTQLASGPGKLCQAFQIDKSLNGVDVTLPDSPIQVENSPDKLRVLTSERIGIRLAANRKWRFYSASSAHVSKKSAVRRES